MANVCPKVSALAKRPAKRKPGRLSLHLRASDNSARPPTRHTR